MLKKGQPSEASPRKRVRRDKRQLLNRVQLAEKPVRLAVDAGGEEERVRWTGVDTPLPKVIVQSPSIVNTCPF